MMNQSPSSQHTFRHWLSTLTFTEISIYVFMIVTVIGGLASIFFGIEFALLSIIVLLLAIVWYQLEATRHTHRLLEAGKIEIIQYPEDIFTRGVSTLEKGQRQGGWKKVRIYAPVGIADPSPEKTRWLEALKSSLDNRSVQEFSALFALPSDESLYYAFAKKRLELFEHTPCTEIHYLPPDDEKHPTAAEGLGAIIFEDRDNDRYEIIFAFVGQANRGPMIRSGFVLRDKNVCSLVTDWFDNQIFKGTSKNCVLIGTSPTRKDFVNFKTVLATIEEEYYSSINSAA
ncbi:MAG: hypothetical protein NVSMB33_16330 [Ktedonobacteraceae bacterium]